MNEQISKYIKVIFSRVWILLVMAIVSAGAVYYHQWQRIRKKV